MKHLVLRKVKFQSLLKLILVGIFLMVDKIRGQEVDVRHILLTPKIEPAQLKRLKVN